MPVRAVLPLRLPPQAPALGCGSQTMRLDRGRARITAEVRAALADLGLTKMPVQAGCTCRSHPSGVGKSELRARGGFPLIMLTTGLVLMAYVGVNLARFF